MGYFIRDNNISAGNIGIQTGNIGTTSIDRSTVSLSPIEQSAGNINKTAEMTTLDLGDIFGIKTNETAIQSSEKVLEGQVNLAETDVQASEVTGEKLTKDDTKTESINQSTGDINKGTSLDNSTKINGNTNAGNGAGVNGANGGNFSAAGGSGGGSWSSTSGGNTGGKGASKPGGLTGVTAGIAGTKGGASATGAKVSGKTMQSSRPVITTGSIDSTGARMTSLPLTVDEASNLLDAMKNTGAHIAGKITGFIREKINIKSFAATAAIVVSSVVFKLLQMIEALVDGVDYYVAALEDLVGLEEDAQRRREGIAVDNTGDLEKKLYEDTAIGKAINEASLIKYDGLVAKGIKRFTGTVVKIAAVFFLGPEVAAGIGFFSGTGEAAQSAYANALENGNEDLKLGFWGNTGIVFSGALGAIEWASYKGPAEGLGNILAEAATEGPGFVLSEIGKQFFSRETLTYIKENLGKTAFKSFLQTAGDFGKIISKYLNGQEVTKEDYFELLKDYALNFGINVIIGRSVKIIGGYKVPKNPTIEVELEKNDKVETMKDHFESARDTFKDKLKGRNVSKDAKKAKEMYETIDEHDKEIRKYFFKLIKKIGEFYAGGKDTEPIYPKLTQDEREDLHRLVLLMTVGGVAGVTKAVKYKSLNISTESQGKLTRNINNSVVKEALVNFEAVKMINSIPREKVEQYSAGESVEKALHSEVNITRDTKDGLKTEKIPKLGTDIDNSVGTRISTNDHYENAPAITFKSSEVNNVGKIQEVDSSSNESSVGSSIAVGNSSHVEISGESSGSSDSDVGDDK